VLKRLVSLDAHLSSGHFLWEADPMACGNHHGVFSNRLAVARDDGTRNSATVRGKTRSAEKHRNPWGILVVACVGLVSFATSFQSVPPILPLLVKEFGFTHVQAGSLMSFFCLVGVFISIPAGMLADRHGQKGIGLISLLCIIAGAALFASGDGMLSLAVGRILSGIGGMTLLVVTPQALAQWFRGRKLGLAMGLLNTSMPLGTILSLNLFSFLGGEFGWRTSVWLSAVFPFIAFWAFLMFFQSAPRDPSSMPVSPEGIFERVRAVGKEPWLVGLAWLFFNASVISLFTFTPKFLNTSGFSLASSGFLASLTMWPQLVTNPGVGFLISRIGRTRVIAAIGGVSLGIFIVLIPFSVGWAALWLLLVGIVMSLVPTPVFTLVQEVVRPQHLGMGYGILSTCLNLGILIGPVASGMVVDLTQSYPAGYALMGAFSFMASLSTLFLGIKAHRKAE
jgi:predicted MFS family arabinose efflux permease